MAKIDPNGLYCAYLRKSRRDLELEAQGQGETLARHERQLSDLAQRLGLRIARTYREIVSGDTIAERPEIRQLLADLNAGLWSGVLVMDVDRLARGDSIDQGVIMQSFMYSGTLIITPDKTYNPGDDSDAEFFEMKLFFSRREYNMIKKRMQRGRAQSALDGCYCGSRDVYGYRRCKLKGRKGWSLEIVPEEADIVRSMFSWYAYGMDGEQVGVYIIARKLNELGIPSDRGGPWIPSTVRSILINPVYIGKIRWNHKTTQIKIVDGKKEKTRLLNPEKEIYVDGLHEPIIDADLWQRVQEMFHGHEKRPKNAMRKDVNPFGGLLICPQCGHKMQTKGCPNRQGDFLYCPTQGCPTCSAYVFAVEDLVLETLGGWVADFEARQVDEAPREDADVLARDAALARQRAELEALEAQSGRLYDLLEQGVYSVQVYKQRRTELDARLARTREAIDALTAIAPADPIGPLIPQIRIVIDAYRAAPTPGDKNALLRTVIDHIEYHKLQRCMRNNKPGDFLTLVIYPKIPEFRRDSF